MSYLYKHPKKLALILLLSIIFSIFIANPLYIYFNLKSNNNSINYSKIDLKVFKVLNSSFYKNIHLNSINNLKHITQNYHIINSYSINNITYYLCVNNKDKDTKDALQFALNNLNDISSNFSKNVSVHTSILILWIEDVFDFNIFLKAKTLAHFFIKKSIINPFIDSKIKPPMFFNK